MKTIKLFSIIVTCLFITSVAVAQKVKTESFKVAGECGMCKKKIEKAAKEAGATTAVWSPSTKMIKVSYNVNAASTSSIQQAIANTGYDTPQYKANEDAYNNLDECCKYERQAAKEKCCTDKCEKKDGKCTDVAGCKEKGCDTETMSCCKKSE